MPRYRPRCRYFYKAFIKGFRSQSMVKAKTGCVRVWGSYEKHYNGWSIQHMEIEAANRPRECMGGQQACMGDRAERGCAKDLR